MLKKSPKYYSQNASYLGWGEGSVLDKERLALIKKYIIKENILDIGCGFGLYVDYLSKIGYQATGIDFVLQFIKSARKNKKGTFIKGNVEKLPFGENQFETVFLFDILEHGNDKLILTEAIRVSKKRILVIVPKKVDKILADSGVVFRHYMDKSHLREYQLEDLKALADSLGLKLVHIEKIHPVSNKAVFLSLFKGPIFLRKIIREFLFLILPKESYMTEIFAVFDKK